MQFRIPFPVGASNRRSKPRWSNQNGQLLNQNGQLVVEYVLLLVVAVAIAYILRVVFVKPGDNPQDSGMILNAWDTLEQAIGKDDPNHRP